MKKYLIIMTALAVLSFSAIGCGKSNQNESSDISAEEVNDNLEAVEEDSEEARQEVEAAQEVVDTRTPLQKYWEGDWYGIFWITGGTGDYATYANQYWDAMGTIDLDEDGNADMVLWYEAQDRDHPVAEVKLTISEDSGSGEMGAAISESGYMFANSDTGNGDISHAEWIIDPMTDQISTKYGNDMIHIEGDYLDGTGEIYYHFFLRKWGTLWEDVVNDPTMLYPGLYQDWYKPLVEAGYAMPQNIGDEGSVMMADAAAAVNTKSEDTNTEARTETDSGVVESSYNGEEIVLLDDEYCKIVVMGTGCNPYNDSWIGYVVELTNKTDFTIYFTSYAEPNQEEQTLESWGTGNTCYYKGEKCKTHFGENIKAGATMENACLAIDGVTDVSQLGNVKGYISVSNNETGEILSNVPYSF